MAATMLHDRPSGGSSAFPKGDLSGLDVLGADPAGELKLGHVPERSEAVQLGGPTNVLDRSATITRTLPSRSRQVIGGPQQPRHRD